MSIKHTTLYSEWKWQVFINTSHYYGKQTHNVIGWPTTWPTFKILNSYFLLSLIILTNFSRATSILLISPNKLLLMPCNLPWFSPVETGNYSVDSGNLERPSLGTTSASLVIPVISLLPYWYSSTLALGQQSTFSDPVDTSSLKPRSNALSGSIHCPGNSASSTERRRFRAFRNFLPLATNPLSFPIPGVDQLVQTQVDPCPKFRCPWVRCEPPPCGIRNPICI